MTPLKVDQKIGEQRLKQTSKYELGYMGVFPKSKGNIGNPIAT